MLRLPQVLEAVGIGRTAWLEMVRSGEAPKPIRIGRAVAWPASEVQGFIRERIRLSRGAR
ncbi:MAG: AlpA family phage regulatory protein [Candidatus Omnitrophica bacterium]|nr:AlpA family phage regulatory protein [Candidatus Omnitrophota bacterium]